jgi:hypothetical protein
VHCCRRRALVGTHDGLRALSCRASRRSTGCAEPRRRCFRFTQNENGSELLARLRSDDDVSRETVQPGQGRPKNANRTRHGTLRPVLSTAFPSPRDNRSVHGSAVLGQAYMRLPFTVDGPRICGLVPIAIGHGASHRRIGPMASAKPHLVQQPVTHRPKPETKNLEARLARPQRFT